MVWSSQGSGASGETGGSAPGVFFQRYTAAGATVGAETRVNTTTAGAQQNASVAMDSAGNFVIAWQGNGTQAGNVDAAGVFFQRYNAAGTAQLSETRVNTTTTNTQSNPSVAMDPSGNFIVAWAGEGTQAGNADTSGVFFQRYNAAGTAQLSETRVNTTTTNTQSNPSVAMDPSGNFIVAWQGEGTGDAAGVFFQRYSAAGAAQGSETRANTTTANAQQTATVSMDMNGNFTIAWAAMSQPGETAATWAVVKQDFNADGTANGNEIRVNSTAAGDQNAPGVAMNRFGEYVVAWSGVGAAPENPGPGVFFQRFVSALIVDTANDVLDGTVTSIANLVGAKGADGFISLREAITATNNSANVGSPDRIYFRIGGAAASGVKTIAPAALGSLPNIIDAVIIDATTQSGFAGSPLIELDGVSAGAVNALTITGAGASGSTIRGFVIDRFADAAAVRIIDSSNNTVAGNWLGTDETGAAAGANLVGVFIQNGDDNVVGGTDPADRNVISGNSVDGVQIWAGSTGNVVLGNYIGTNATGAADLGNTNQGVAIFGAASGNTVGGVAVGAGNVISGNNGEGIVIRGAGTTLNQVLGNYIGTNAAGTAAIGNGTLGGTGDGVQIDQGATSNTIGGASAAARNVISGNLDDAVEIRDAGTTGNRVLGNWIGLNAAGNNRIANADDGVVISNDADGNFIGGTAAGEGNVISGNTGTGVVLLDTGTSINQLLGNTIGLAPNGTAQAWSGNGADGVRIQNSASNNVVGGSASGAGNLIGNNTGSGVSILDNSDNNTIRGNWIGTDQTGTIDLGNTLHGVRVAGGAAAGSSPTTTIVGGILAGEANTIAFNGGDGVEVSGAAQAVSISGNSIHSNDGLGIDLAADGVTVNDAGDGDGATGPNTLQNYPKLFQALVSGPEPLPERERGHYGRQLPAARLRERSGGPERLRRGPALRRLRRYRPSGRQLHLHQPAREPRRGRARARRADHGHRDAAHRTGSQHLRVFRRGPRGWGRRHHRDLSGLDLAGRRRHGRSDLVGRDDGDAGLRARRNGFRRERPVRHLPDPMELYRPLPPRRRHRRFPQEPRRRPRGPVGRRHHRGLHRCQSQSHHALRRYGLLRRGERLPARLPLAPDNPHVPFPRQQRHEPDRADQLDARDHRDRLPARGGTPVDLARSRRRAGGRLQYRHRDPGRRRRRP